MSEFLKLHRHQEIQRIRGDLERGGFPRFQMLLLVTLTGGSGFASSYILLHVGLAEMWFRYLASFGVAYLMFLLLLWLWLRTSAGDYAEFPDFSGSSPSGSGGSGPCHSGAGGDLGSMHTGGLVDSPHEVLSAKGDSGSALGDAFGTVAEAEEFAAPLFVLVLAAAMVCLAALMIYSAPTLFAELLVDGVLSASLYRRIRGLEARHWLETAVRRTAVPFAITAAIVSAFGWGMSLYAPEAHSIGDVISHSKRGG